MTSGAGRKLILDLIYKEWVQRFMERHSIVFEWETGKLQISSKSQEMIEKSVAFFNGTVGRELKSGEFVEENIENADETHFNINFNYGKNLGLRDELCVKYADVTSEGEGIDMLVRISGGKKS